MIELKKVSKFYYNKGIIASGFNKINLKFDIGEFVAITGESGSGKSTLLNVISGLDSYEEGEMYINGEETSHYTEQDFENYRRKYIGNIFQNFNLVNSYTVYQNIELVLLLNGEKNIKEKILSLIEQVHLTKYKNTKVSRLSGGQKQRVAIARALAKETPIIIADEPTGNLDSKSATDIFKILNEISKDKLVIIVTHNYEQVEKYVTRKIIMHDGKVLEDKKIKDVVIKKDVKLNEVKNITFLNRIRLGIRNTFNIIPKFLLLSLVFLFVIISLISEYTSFKKEQYLNSKNGENTFFVDTNDKRIVIKKQTKESFTDDDFNKMTSIKNVDYIVKNDLLLDRNISLTDGDYDFWIYGIANNKDNYKVKIDVGKMPTKDNEIIISGSKDDYYLGYRAKELIGKTLYFNNDKTSMIDKSIELVVTGISYKEENKNYNSIYVSDEVLQKLQFQINEEFSNIKVLFNDLFYKSELYSPYFSVVPNSNINDGSAYITRDLSSFCKYESCLNYPISIYVDNIYYNDTLNLNIEKTYTKKNMESLLGITDFDNYNYTVFISNNDYNNLFNKDNYQASVFVDDVINVDNVAKKLNKLGYTTLIIKDALAIPEVVHVLELFKTIVTVLLVIVLFFISYFVIKLILKSRNVYYSTIRMLGANKTVSKQLLIIDLLTVFNLSYIVVLIVVYLNSKGIINAEFINDINRYLKITDYIFLYVILLLMSYLLSQKYAKKLFKNSAMKTIQEVM